VSVAVKKIEGVQSVNVSLNKGLVTIDLAAGNHLTMAQLRGVIKANGFSPKEANVVIDGSLQNQSGTPVLRVDGTDESLIVVASSHPPARSANVEPLAAEGAHVEITGVIEPSKDTGRLAVTAVKRLP
jgi:copper chaperone CopZ